MSQSVELRDEFTRHVADAVGGRGPTTAVSDALEWVLERARLADELRIGYEPPSRRALYDSLAGTGPGEVVGRGIDRLEVVHRPGDRLGGELRAGDLWLQRTAETVEAAVLAGGDLIARPELESRGLQPVESRAGFYAAVVEGGSFPKPRHEGWARRLAGPDRRLRHDSLVVRVRESELDGHEAELPAEAWGDETTDWDDEFLPDRSVEDGPTVAGPMAAGDVSEFDWETAAVDPEPRPLDSSDAAVATDDELADGESDETDHGELVVSLGGGAVLLPGEALVLDFSRPVDADSVRHGLAIHPDIAGDLQVAEDGLSATFVPRAPFDHESYRVSLDGVTAESGRQPIDGWEADFRAFRPPETADEEGAPGGWIVLNRKPVRLDTDEVVELRKILDPESDEAAEVAVEENGTVLSPEETAKVRRRRRRRRPGKVHPVLARHLRGRRRRDRTTLAVWIDAPEEFVDKARYLDRERRPLVADVESGDEGDEEMVARPPRPGVREPAGVPRELLRYRREIAQAKQRARSELRSAGVRVVGELETVPVLLVEAGAREVRRMERLRSVTRIFLYEPEGIEDLTNSLSASRANLAHSGLGFKGTNIRVGVWEGGPDNLGKLVVSEHFDSTRSHKSSHARLVTAVIRNRQSGGPHGYAPEARIYSANKMSLDALEWAITSKRCTVINQSFHRKSEAQNGDISGDDQVKDYFATHYPFPTIVHAAGNFWSGDSDGITPPSNEFVNHKGYNTLSVGSHNDATTAMATSSVYRNPPSDHNDRELPELCANGTAVSAVGLSKGGTSFASPAVAGTVALLQNADNTLIHWPEGNRAILLAGAGRNVRGKTWYTQVRSSTDGRDGAGALDARESVRIARRRRRRNNSGNRRGYDVGTLRGSDFDSSKRSTFAYRVQLPSDGSRRKVRVALAWNSTTTSSGSGTSRTATTKLELDHDLILYDGSTPVAWSASWDNSFEVIDYRGTAGKTYTIRIRRWSGSGQTYFGVAWTVHS